MNEKLEEAIEQFVQTAEGKTAAQMAVQDALISTLLKHFPPLAEPFLETLGLAEDHYRLHLPEDSFLAHSALRSHLAHIRTLVEHVTRR